MERPPIPRTRRLTVIAQDPSVRSDGKILRAHVEVPAEELRPGPWGYRVQVFDYDVSTDTFYKPREEGLDGDPYAEADDAVLLSDPAFHGQNVYALAMRTLARFELALGRRVSWGFAGHQLQIVPHAFADANAFYSRDDHALLFGYFPGRQGDMVFTCLSHDVIVHEATHALLDGLRERYNDPSSPDQAAFHEGFADVAALLSVFSLPRVTEKVIDLAFRPDGRELVDRETGREMIDAAAIMPDRLRLSGLFGLADQMGREMGLVRGDALRRSVELIPSPDYYRSRGQFEEFEEPHRRGEILVAAMMNTFLEVWSHRLSTLGQIREGRLDRSRVVEEGAAIADTLLTMSSRSRSSTRFPASRASSRPPLSTRTKPKPTRRRPGRMGAPRLWKSNPWSPLRCPPRGSCSSGSPSWGTTTCPIAPPSRTSCGWADAMCTSIPAASQGSRGCCLESR